MRENSSSTSPSKFICTRPFNKESQAFFRIHLRGECRAKGDFSCSWIGFWCGFFYLKAIWNANLKKYEVTGYLWENFWKTRICVQKTVSADKLISIWEHHRQVFLFETWRGSLDYKTVPGIFDFFSFVFKIWLWTFHVRNIERFFGNKAVKKWEGDWISKIPRTLFETRYWWAHVWALSSYPFWRSILEKEL